MKLIELNKKYVTRDGRSCEVLKIDAAGHFPVIVLVKYPEGTDSLARMTEYGRANCDQRIDSSNDLVDLPKQYAGWVNVFERKPGVIQFSRLYSSPETLPLLPEPGSRLIARLWFAFPEGQDL